MQTSSASKLRQHGSSDKHLRILVVVLFSSIDRTSVLNSKGGHHPCQSSMASSDLPRAVASEVKHSKSGCSSRSVSGMEVHFS